jgi:hypothetical protein
LGIPVIDRDNFDATASGARPSYDLDWYGVDQFGCIALLTSAGFGPVPKPVFRNMEHYLEVQHYFETLPFRCECDVLVAGRGQIKSWQEAARRGLFAYDYQHQLERWPQVALYSAMARPRDALLSVELPKRILEWLSPLHFQKLVFAEAIDLRPEQMFEELNHGP